MRKPLGPGLEELGPVHRHKVRDNGPTGVAIEDILLEQLADPTQALDALDHVDLDDLLSFPLDEPVLDVPAVSVSDGTELLVLDAHGVLVPIAVDDKLVGLEFIERGGLVVLSSRSAWDDGQ